MKIEQKGMLDFLGTPGARFAIPVFQRVYSWTARQCEELWEDCLRAGEGGKAHFMGLVLYAPDADGGGVLDVIDGQQRLTTLSLLIAALERRDLTARCLQVFDRGGGARPKCKLVLSGADAPTLAAIVGAGEMPEEPASRLVENYLLFKGKVDALSDMSQLLRGLKELQVATVELAPEDSPQLVFESLNSKGMSLNTADRVRNLIVASTQGDEQDALFEGKWLPLERRAAEADPPATMTSLLHAWLAEKFRSERIFDQSEVYGLFKRQLTDEFSGSLEKAFDELATYADRYLSDPEVRAEADASVELWVTGRPDELISEYKMFGD